MHAIKIEEVIQAPVERVFEIFADIPGTGTRISAITRLEMLSEGPIGRGTRWRETRVMFGREAVEVMWISEFDPPRSYSVEAENSGAKYLTRYDFISENGGTRVVLTFGAEAQTFFAKMMGKVFFKLMAKSVREALKKDMVELKEICEAAA